MSSSSITTDPLPPLRRATEADVPALVALGGAVAGGWDADAYAAELKVAWSSVLVLEDSESEASGVVGGVVFWRVVDETQLLNIAVAPDHRRRGFALHMMRHVVEAARRAGHRRISLEVRRDNRAARALYRRLGFQSVGQRRGYYADTGEDAILMELVI
jgi:ribosomal-protein-alanine N-acetyltransferase